VSSRASASRYSRALFDIALQESDPRVAERELTEFNALLQGHDELKRTLASPGVPLTSKRNLLQALVTRVNCSAPVAKLLLLLAERDRLGLLPDIVDVFRERLMEHEKAVHADITTAAALQPEQTKQLEQRLSDLTQRRVTVTAKVDPAIIGGVVARIGSTVFDGSVATQLARLRDRLVEQR
jgi:F-type H+-transporting ATPase subunit delta